jgi:hypothetical protein
MQYLKKSFDKLNKNKKLSAVEEIIAELSKIKNSIVTNYLGQELLEFINFDKSSVEEQIQELKQELKDLSYSNNKSDYCQKELMELNILKENIKKEDKKLEILNDIENISVSKDKNYDHNEGWLTTEKNLKIMIEFKNNITLKVNYYYEFNGYDNSEGLDKYIYIYKDDNELKKNVDYYIEDDKYYNGKKLDKNLNSMNNFKKNLENKKLENLTEKELLSILHNTKKESETIKKEIFENEKNRNTSWSRLLNEIIDKLDDKEEFMHYFH